MMAQAQILIEFKKDAIDVAQASSLPSINCGGECIFVGRTRPESHETHGTLVALLYDCYVAMAAQELQVLAEEVVKRYAVRTVRITHSTGRVNIDEASVVIAVGSNHRDDAFLACRFLIDLLKQRVPIWKKELWTDGSTWSDGAPLSTS